MPDFTFEQAGGIGFLHFSGGLSQDCKDKLRQGLMVSFESSDYVVVNFTNVAELDAGCFSMFCSAFRIFKRCNKRLLLVGLGLKTFGAKNASGPAARPSFCASECREGCLWDG